MGALWLISLGPRNFAEAVHGQHLGIVRRLAGAGCGVNLCESFQEFSPLHTAVRMCCHNYFIEASAGGHSALDMVRQLIQYCDLNVLDKQHWSPLHQAAFGGELGESLLHVALSLLLVALMESLVRHRAGSEESRALYPKAFGT